MAAILADNILKWIFLNENGGIAIQISLKFVPTSPIDNTPAFVQVMANMRQTIIWTNIDPLHRRIYDMSKGIRYWQVSRYIPVSAQARLNVLQTRIAKVILV